MNRNAYHPPLVFRNGHVQTIFPSLCRKVNGIAYRRERIDTADGDFLDLDWSRVGSRRLAVISHGLEGNSQRHYVRGMVRALNAHHIDALAWNYRGCSGEPNRLARRYHSGDTADLQTVLAHLASRNDPKPLAVIGYSLGGNVLLKALGEGAGMDAVRTAVAVSVPFDLDRAAWRLRQGVSRIYQRYLLNKLRQSYRAKLPTHIMPVSSLRLDALDTFRKFDNEVTAPLHGFRDVDDYYGRSSSRQYLQAITTPTLVLHAADDPFVPGDAIPTDSELGPGVTLELSRHGGHVGFVAGDLPFRAHYWLETRICAHMREYL